jgi:CRISPR-associated endonuclease/helicase Cas3
VAISGAGSVNLAIFWAKTDRQDPSGAFHPLVYHLIDVGEVAAEIWRTVLTRGTRAALSKAIGLSEEEAGRWIAFWAATHDVGKLSPSFQLQNGSAKARINAARLPYLDPPLPARHGTISARVLEDILVQDYGHLPELASRIATVVGGHHGVFPTRGDIRAIRSDHSGKGAWARARSQLLRLIAESFSVPANAPSGALDNPSAMLLAGLISVADWLGSNETFFGYAASSSSPWSFDPVTYAGKSRQNVEYAFERLGWRAWPSNTEPRSFADLFPHIRAPNALQIEIESISADLRGPGIIVVEAPMGEGKTEAAFFLADHTSSTLGQHGAYVALPTRATSNQMFTRLRDFIQERHQGEAVNLQLLHGLADLSADFRELRQRGDALFSLTSVGDPTERRAELGVVAGEWFTHRKRGLLAPFGVGTVDQVLLAVLQTRHSFVRLFALANKTVIVDEVHAYDTYMSTLLEGLVGWLAAVGATVVLLSATLPRQRSDSLVTAYAKGRGVSSVSLPDDVPYPRVSWYAEGTSHARHVEPSALARKVLHLTPVSGELPTDADQSFAAGAQLAKALENGGCAAVICNTVGRAQKVFDALKRHFRTGGEDPELDLLHARFLFDERDRRERRSLFRFGRSPDSRPHRAVLVATQIIEQSLDLDFDLMVTDFAPIDLLLQRSGRLWRHQRTKAARHDIAGPDLWVCAPPLDSIGLPAFDGGTAAIYDRHVLLRSWLALRGWPAIKIPSDIDRLVEAVYDENCQCPDDASPALAVQWADTLATQARRREDHIAKARSFGVLPPDDQNIFAPFNRELEEDAPEISESLQALTRLGEPSVNVVFLQTEDYRRVDQSRKPEPAEIERFLRNSVTLSGYGIVKATLALDGPPGWRKSPFIRHHRLVEIDDQGTGEIEPYRIRVDPELGIIVEKT